jgi:hypothetical protein
MSQSSCGGAFGPLFAVPRTVRLSPVAPGMERLASVRVAYQVVGDGPIDLIFVPWWWNHWKASGTTR